MEAIRKFVRKRKTQKNFLSGFLISQNRKQLKTPLLFLILFWCFSLNANAQSPTDVTLSVNAEQVFCMLHYPILIFQKSNYKSAPNQVCQMFFHTRSPLIKLQDFQQA
jgi:hypothetical protein